ncbi:hypothetical protein SAMN05443545_10910 [Aidingimonas halophila]|uniref:Uncharacterized protein n=1 Tax=Aidingimonas halophila TaxID=574349 RepID=A0A1H3G4M4_9GAMM|nr:hypothetical protein GCM10008094_26530 [Aidingimonas halophila]SDX98272.1 hypothetical protein SAMN05443545_10910 [Aidingimonas halophila]
MNDVNTTDNKAVWITPELSRMGIESTLSGSQLAPLEDTFNLPFLAPSDPDS